MRNVIEIAEEYLTNMCLAEKLNSLCGIELYCSANNDRGKLHRQICELLGVEHTNLEVLTMSANLDKVIGFNPQTEYSADEIREFAVKLVDAIKELK